jgi:hypothetical protein
MPQARSDRFQIRLTAEDGWLVVGGAARVVRVNRDANRLCHIDRPMHAATVQRYGTGSYPNGSTVTDLRTATRNN